MLAYRTGALIATIRVIAKTALRSASLPVSVPVVVGWNLPAASKGFQIRTIRVTSLDSSTRMADIPENEDLEILPGSNDHYGGVMVDMKEQMEPIKFGSLLRSSMFHWRKQGKRGVWIKLPIHLASLVQPAVEEGFWYHHAEASYLMLVYWIPDTDNTLPVNATHRVGVGAFVMNDKREVLAVQEKNGKLRGQGIWKLPTGVVDPGENIYDGAIREVREETGIDTEFVEILAFRQSHKVFFEKSDLFFICLLRPLSFDIQKQDSEIEAAEWMPIEEFEAQKFVQKNNILWHTIKVGTAKMDKNYAGFSVVTLNPVISKQQEKSYIYLNMRDVDI